MDLVILGSGGWIPTGTRETCCALLRRGPEALLIDAGTGVRRLLTEPDWLEGTERITILLSHFHLDHTAGLSFLPALPDRIGVELIGPGAALYGRPTAEILGELLRSPLFPVPLRRVLDSVRDLDDVTLELAGIEIAWRHQPLHTDPTVGYRFDDRIAYCTDTAYDAATADFARGAQVLLHEAVFAGGWVSSNDHSSSGEAALLARDAGVERLVLIHRSLQPATDEELLEAALAAFPATVVATDGLVVSA